MIALDSSQKHGYALLSQGRIDDSHDAGSLMNRWSNSARSLYRRRPLQFIVLAVVGISVLAIVLVAITSGLGGGGFTRGFAAPSLPFSLDLSRRCPTPPAPAPDSADKVIEIDMERYLAPMAKLHVCFSLASLLDFGGVETWFWMLYDHYFNVPPFKVHAVDVEGAFAPRVAGRLTRGATRINIGAPSQLLECDLIISTGS